MASRVLFSSRRLSLVLEIAPRISFAPPKVVPFLQPRSHFSDKPREEPSDKVKELTDQILSLNFLEVNQLLLRLQDRLGVSDDFLMQAMGGGGGGGAPAAAASTAAPEPVKEKESFDLKMTSIDQKAKIKIIKEIRTITGLGLKEAKEMVEKAPVVVKNGLPKAEAEQLAKVLKEAGAEVELV